MPASKSPLAVYCSHCGTKNQENDQLCTQCGLPIGHVGTTTDPAATPDSPKWLTSAVIAVLCALYLIYPSMGVFELIPDNLPFVGNLDEAAATTGLWISLSRLGLNPFTK